MNSGGAAEVAEAVGCLIAFQLAGELGAAGSQAGNGGVNVVDGEGDVADARCVRRGGRALSELERATPEG